MLCLSGFELYSRWVPVTRLAFAIWMIPTCSLLDVTIDIPYLKCIYCLFKFNLYHSMLNRAS